MLTIRQVINDREPYSVRDSTTALEAARYLASRNIGAVCVTDGENRLLGIFSERDLLKRVVLQGNDPAEVKVRDVMSELRAVISCDETPHDAIRRMEKIGTRHLPVMEGDKWVGMLSIRDLLRVEVGEKADEVRLLQDYISQ
jgi:CBS domain-containing protein